MHTHRYTPTHTSFRRFAAFPHEFFFLACDCKGLLKPIGVTLYKLGESNLLAHINEVLGEGAEQRQTETHGERKTGRNMWR